MRPSLLAPLAALLALTAGAHAQGQNNYGSIYSRYGFGERLDFGTSQSAALGHAGVAVRHPSYHTLSNPALWSDAVVTTFSASASVAAVRGEDALSSDASVGTAGDLAGLHIGVPLLPGRLGFVLGYRPYSRVNYRSAVRDRVIVEGDTAAYTLNLEGSGGLQQLSAGLGVRLGPAQLGASADLVFGTGETLQRTRFDRTDFLQPRQAEATRAIGVTATLGGAVTARRVGGDDGTLTLGGALTLPTALDASRSVVLGESLDRDTLVAARDGDATLPLVARAGLAWQDGGRWLATVDGLYEPWGGFDSSLPVGGFDAGAGLDALRDRWRVGGGVEVTPAGRDFRAGALRRTSYRLGGYAERGLYAPGGTDVTTLALTGGLSVPNRFTGARIDLGFEVGTRGSTEGVLVRDTFVKGTFTLNFGERWFVRRRFD